MLQISLNSNSVSPSFFPLTCCSCSSIVFVTAVEKSALVSNIMWPMAPVELESAKQRLFIFKKKTAVSLSRSHWYSLRMSALFSFCADRGVHQLVGEDTNWCHISAERGAIHFYIPTCHAPLVREWLSVSFCAVFRCEAARVKFCASSCITGVMTSGAPHVNCHLVPSYLSSW